MSEKPKDVVESGLELLNQAKTTIRGVRGNQIMRLEAHALASIDKAIEFLDGARVRFECMDHLLKNEAEHKPEHKPEHKTERPRGVPEDAEFDVVITAALDGRVIEERLGKDGEAFESFGHDPDDAEKIGRDMIKGARLARLATKLDDDPGAG